MAKSFYLSRCLWNSCTILIPQGTAWKRHYRSCATVPCFSCFATLDVSLCSSFKSFFQQEIHNLWRAKKVLNVFDISVALFFSYFQCITPRNICDGFMRTETWNSRTIDVARMVLHELFRENEKMTLESLLGSFSRQSRSHIWRWYRLSRKDSR